MKMSGERVKLDERTEDDFIALERLIKQAAANPRPYQWWVDCEEALARIRAKLESALAEPEQSRCDHKFVDSNHCIKCGWFPGGTYEREPEPGVPSGNWLAAAMRDSIPENERGKLTFAAWEDAARFILANFTGYRGKR